MQVTISSELLQRVLAGPKDFGKLLENRDILLKKHHGFFKNNIIISRKSDFSHKLARLHCCGKIKMVFQPGWKTKLQSVVEQPACNLALATAKSHPHPGPRISVPGCNACIACILFCCLSIRLLFSV
jgi:hypothetical protein